LNYFLFAVFSPLILLCILSLKLYEILRWIVDFSFGEVRRIVEVEEAIMDVVSRDWNNFDEIVSCINAKYNGRLATLNGKMSLELLHIYLDSLVFQGKIVDNETQKITRTLVRKPSN
jgi:hypothetical protein